MNLETILPLAIPATFIAFIVAERLAPARPLPKVSWWKAKGVLFFILAGVLSTAAPMLWMDFIRAHRLVDLEWTGTLGGAAIGFVGFQLVSYWWHRLCHGSTLLWRGLHQMHHSAERVDVFGASYFHPMDVVAFSFIQSTVLYMVLGISGQAALLTGVVGLFYAFFQHANIRTPRWLGYFIQRPEAHSVHHGRGVHAWNYADLPLWDIVFGTFRNPAAFEAEAGFWDGASRRVGALLRGCDVARSPLGRAPTSAS